MMEEDTKCQPLVFTSSVHVHINSNMYNLPPAHKGGSGASKSLGSISNWSVTLSQCLQAATVSGLWGRVGGRSVTEEFAEFRRELE